MLNVMIQQSMKFVLTASNPMDLGTQLHFFFLTNLEATSTNIGMQ